MLLLWSKSPQIWYQNVEFGELYPNKYRFYWYANQWPHQRSKGHRLWLKL